MKVTAWVPMKLSNERLPGKNTKILGDKPLCQHMLGTLLNVAALDEIIVFCSNPDITQYLPKGIRFVQRSADLDKSTTTAAEVMDSLTSMVDSDIYVHACVTNPFIKASTISDGVQKVLSGEYDSAHIVSPIQNHLWYHGKPFNFSIDNIPRTQDLEPIYEDAGLFVYKKEIWTKGRSRYSENPYFMVCDKIEAIDIDYPDDFKYAEAVYKMIK